MLALKIIGIIAAVIALIMLIPIGADIGYEGGVFSLSAKVCGVLLQLFPKPPENENAQKKEDKPKNKKKSKKTDEEAPQGEKQKKKLSLNFSRDELLLLVRKVLRRFGRFGRKFRVDRFLLHYTAAGDDPYNTAVTFGYINAALSSLAPLCRERFDVKDCDVRTDIDFSREKTEVDFGIAFSIRIGAIFGLVFGIAFSALGILIKNKLRLRAEKRHGGRNMAAEDDTVIDIEIDKDKENIQAEERMDSNG